MNLSEAKTYLIEEGELAETEPGFDAGLVLLGSAVVGPNVKRISSWAGIPRDIVALYGKRLRDNGIWVGSKIHAEWFDEKTGGIAFFCDVNVALGHMERH